MRYREIPGTGIRVSELSFGAESLAAGWWGDHGDDDAVRLLHAAQDRGITLFDTADRDGDGYGDGLLKAATRQEGQPSTDEHRLQIGTKSEADIANGWSYPCNGPSAKTTHTETDTLCVFCVLN